MGGLLWSFSLLCGPLFGLYSLLVKALSLAFSLLCGPLFVLLLFSLLALPFFCLITIFHTYMQTLHFELRGDEEDFIQLIQLLKATNLVYNGAEAQEVVAAGMVLRNGVVETRKRAKIVRGDVIEYEGNRIEVI